MNERISESELAVMEIVWVQSPTSAADVIAAVAGPRGWTAATVKTLLARLVAKGALATAQEGRRYLYTPLIAREDHRASAAQRMVNRLFGGRLSPLVAQFAERETLSEADIADLKAIIERLES